MYSTQLHVIAGVKQIAVYYCCSVHVQKMLIVCVCVCVCVGDALVPGLLVVAKWRHNGWYAATIVKTDRQKVQVDYLDGDSKTLGKSNVLPMVGNDRHVLALLMAVSRMRCLKGYRSVLLATAIVVRNRVGRLWTSVETRALLG